MKTLLILIVCLLLTGTVRQAPTQLIRSANLKGDGYCSLVTDDVFKDRCSKLAFKAIVSVNCPQDISKHENSGQWENDEQPCYQNGGMASISRDGILSVLHYIWTTKDKEMLARLIKYGEYSDWVVGKGPRDQVDVIMLTPMIYLMRDKLELTNKTLINYLPTTEDVTSELHGHSLANYIWLQSRVRGYIDQNEGSMVERLFNKNPGDPMYLALMYRAMGQPQDETFFLLLQHPAFPNKSNPTSINAFGWKGAPMVVYYLISLAIAEGK